jgi:cell pole-organizing protein PopZ
MTLFAIDADNNITTYPAAEKIPEGQERFTSEKELAALATNWPADRLIGVWNSFAGVAGFGADLKPVKKFTNRKTAIARIWKAVQGLDGVSEGAATATAEAAAATPAKATPKTPKGTPTKAKATKTTKSAKKATGAPVPREFSKKAAVIDMLRRKGGATLEEITKATDWQNHTIRGFVSGTLTKKMGLTVESAKNADGARYYRITSK